VIVKFNAALRWEGVKDGSDDRPGVWVPVA
jgi:hypothetical protein